MKTVIVLAVLGAVLIAACAADLPPPAKCYDIPAGGCPRRGNACEDPSCVALYLCKADGTWSLDSNCPPRDASVPDVVVLPQDAGTRRDAVVDVPGAFGGPGCESLIAPDCSLGTASTCGQGCCGCEDLFVCEAGGWSLWGTCDQGQLIPDVRDQ